MSPYLTIILKLIATLLLVAMNAFFVLSEFAIVRVRRTRLEELVKQGSSLAKIALDIADRLDSYLSAIQLGITLVSLALGWLGEPLVAKILAPVLTLISDDPNVTYTISIIVAFTIITLLHVVLGELVPKSVAIQSAERMALLVAVPMRVFRIITYPIVLLFDRLATLIVRLIGVSRHDDSVQAHSEEELRMIVNDSRTEGVLDDTKGQIMEGALNFADKTATDIMLPRTEMFCLYTDKSYEDNMQIVLSSPYTRFPLSSSNKDDIIGLVHLRDLLENEVQKSHKYSIEELKREALFVPETMPIADVMQAMRAKQIHLAIVIDEYGGTAGLITLEDILEEIVGDINDEYDNEECDITKIDDNTYEINGQTPIEDVGKELKIQLESGDESIGGFVFSALGRKAGVGDIVEHEGFVFKVVEIDGLRIAKVRVSLKCSE
ncbi:hemolysin family protein [Deferribacterales bacterium RsTz2092]|nr:membrane protein [Deferribacterales bacterium]